MDQGALFSQLHYAGSGASVYHDWPPQIPADVSVQCVQLPGRQERFGEDMFTDVEPLVQTLADCFTAELDGRPYAVFGHCMGALIGYRVTVELHERGERSPVLLGASAWAPKGFRTPPPSSSRCRRANSWTGPVDWAHLEVCASYQDDDATVPCPVVTYSADKDPLVEPEAMASWVRTKSYLGNRLFQGGHFFLHEQTTSITADFVRLLLGRVAGTQPAF
jgi:surfactin synthase thioesterase subunit